MLYQECFKTQNCGVGPELWELFGWSLLCGYILKNLRKSVCLLMILCSNGYEF